MLCLALYIEGHLRERQAFQNSLVSWKDKHGPVASRCSAWIELYSGKVLMESIRSEFARRSLQNRQFYEDHRPFALKVIYRPIMNWYQGKSRTATLQSCREKFADAVLTGPKVVTRRKSKASKVSVGSESETGEQEISKRRQSYGL